MVIDFIIIIFFVYFVIVGFRRGFWLSMIHLSATIVSLWIAVNFTKISCRKIHTYLFHILKQQHLIQFLRFILIIYKIDLKRL
ncbi:CvpA family protein [Staphylococcus aureus]